MLEKMKINYLNMMLCEKMETSIEDCTKLIDQLDAEGRFPDLDYTDQQPNEWQARFHFSRMVRLLSNRQILEQETLRSRAMKGMNFWLGAHLHNPNWWHNAIGQPRLMGMAALLLNQWLTQEHREQALCIIEQGSMYSNPSFFDWTGANLLWAVSNTLQHALFAGDPAIAQRALLYAASELSIKEGNLEGIKPDYSFFQHQTQMYSGGYGRSFIEEISRIVYILQGTPLQLPQTKLRVLADFLLEGQQWFMQDNDWDFTTVGREIARADGIRDSRIKDSLWRLIHVAEMPRRAELQTFYNRVCGIAEPLEGDRYFPYGRIYVCRHHSCYISTRLTDPSQMLGESINRENYYSANLYTGGVTCMMSKGGEYNRVAPVWNPCYIPGSTARVENDQALMGKRSLWHGKNAENTYGRGIVFANGLGCAYQDMNYNGIHGKIARFFFNGVMVALGCGLTAEVPECVVTTLEQCHQKEEPIKLLLDMGEAVYHNGLLYILLDDKMLFCKTEKRTGDWTRINESAVDAPETAEVLTLWIKHGSAIQDASYAYAVVPSDSAYESKKQLSQLRVVANTSAWQAVQVDKNIICIFHQQGVYNLPDGRVISGEVATAVCL